MVTWATLDTGILETKGLLDSVLTELPCYLAEMPPPGGTPPLHPPPDGGWGWVVVGAAFISIGFSYAFPKAVTVFFKEIQLIFNTTYSEIAWIYPLCWLLCMQEAP